MPVREQAAEEEDAVATLEDAVADEQRLSGATFGVLDVTESSRNPSPVYGGEAGLGGLKLSLIAAHEAPAGGCDRPC